MSRTSFNDLKDFNQESIVEEVRTLKKQLFELRLKKAIRQPIKPHLIKVYKRKIAQLLTLQTQRIYILK